MPLAVGIEGPSLTSFLVGSFCIVLAVEDVLHQPPAGVASCHASPTIRDSFSGTTSPNKLVLRKWLWSQCFTAVTGKKKRNILVLAVSSAAV